MTLKDLRDCQQQMFREAEKRYQARHDRDLYSHAVSSDASFTQKLQRSGGLVETAMALCGSPLHAAHELNWSDEELAYLSLFV